MKVTTLYRLYGAGDVLLYVGITDAYERRMVQHSEKAWWAEVVRTMTVLYNDRAEALRAEAAAIRDENPRYNRAGKPGLSRRNVAPVPAISIDAWITIQEAADWMKVTTKTLRRRIADGSIEARRFGPRLIRVNSATLLNASTPVGNWTRPK